ncbi:hypothetical protein UlMin_027493 [Ulmus minor]
MVSDNEGQESQFFSNFDGPYDGDNEEDLDDAYEVYITIWCSFLFYDSILQLNEDGEYVGPRKRDEKGLHFDKHTDLKDPQFKLEQYFPDLDIIRKAVRNYSIINSREVVWEKNDNKRVRVRSQAGCDWLLYARVQTDGKKFRVNTYRGEHSCGLVFKNRRIKSGWLAKEFMEMFRANPKLDHAAFNAFLKDKYCAEISKFQFYRTKAKALKLVEGSIEDQFNLLHNYCLQLRLTNPGSSVHLQTSLNGVGIRVFERVYVFLAACKKGWIEGCRPVVGLDGCFIKAVYSGQLLSAVDANNSIFPVVYAVKGLKLALSHVLPDYEQRSCVRHVYANFKNKFPGLFMKQKLWAVVRATIVEEFNRHMAELKDANVLAFHWLSVNSISEWSRCAFRDGPKCDILLNNFCESFNSTIVGARHKCILTMLEQLGDYLMCRMATRREPTSH